MRPQSKNKWDYTNQNTRANAHHQSISFRLIRRASLWESSFYNWILLISCSFLRWRGTFPICDVCYYFEVPRSAVCRFLSFLVRNISEPFNSNYDFWASGVEIWAFEWEWTILVDLIMEQITTRIFQWDSPRDTAMTMGSNRARKILTIIARDPVLVGDSEPWYGWLHLKWARLHFDFWARSG